MSKKKYLVTVQQEIEIDDAVLKEALKPEWQKYIGKMSKLEVATHIGYNLVRNNITLTQIDGFADRDNAEARTVGRPDCFAEEVKAQPRRRAGQRI